MKRHKVCHTDRYIFLATILKIDKNIHLRMINKCTKIQKVWNCKNWKFICVIKQWNACNIAISLGAFEYFSKPNKPHARAQSAMLSHYMASAIFTLKISHLPHSILMMGETIRVEFKYF